MSPQRNNAFEVLVIQRAQRRRSLENVSELKKKFNINLDKDLTNTPITLLEVLASSCSKSSTLIKDICQTRTRFQL